MRHKPISNPFKGMFSVLRSQNGVALLIALFAMMTMLFIASEVSYDTNVEFVVAAQQAHQIQAYYAARAGIELSLLRVKLYKQVVSQAGSSLGDQIHMLDPIWNFPFSWPPIIPKDANITEVDQGMIKDSLKGSLMEAEYATTIESEGSKLDINDLGSDVKSLQKSTHAQLLKIFQQRLDNDEAFRKKYDGFNFEELVNNIQDWVDADKESLNGGDEKRYYRDFDLEGSNSDFLPPNHPFKTLDELHMVAGMKDDFYNILKPEITIYGTMGINVNYANADMLKALDVSVNDDAVKAIMDRRSDPNKGGPFPSGDQCADDFLNFVKPYGVNVAAIKQSGIPLICDPEYNFRITSTGTVSNVRKEITVITYDIPNLANREATLLAEQDQGPGQNQSSTANGGNNASNSAGNASNNASNGNPGASGGQNSKIEVPKGRPTVVYWEEN